jgi:glutamate carboxypeptidase
MRMRTIVLAVGAAALMTGAAHAAPRDAKVWAAAERLRPDELKLLEEVVNIDSGTGDVEGGRKVAAVFERELRAMDLGEHIRRYPAEATGLADNLVVDVMGRNVRGGARILLIGHLDTVFEPGTAAKRPFRMDADRAYGPGVGDEKGGVVQAISALKILKELGFDKFGAITLLIESSEERGSPGSRKLIAELLKDADVELNLEPGDTPDVITVWRKGSSNFYIDVKGRAAHAGVAPQDGRNAAEELIHQIQGVAGLPKTGDGLTVNLTLMSAGSRFNIIPEDASATFNVRVRDKAQMAAVDDLLEKNARTTLIPDTKVTIRREGSYPPLPNNPATDALALKAQAIYAGLGMTLTTGGNGGASESALAAEAGVPALDGLGPAGGGFHSDKEFIELRTVTPRLYLLTKLIMALGASPPPSGEEKGTWNLHRRFRAQASARGISAWSNTR